VFDFRTGKHRFCVKENQNNTASLCLKQREGKVILNDQGYMGGCVKGFRYLEREHGRGTKKKGEKFLKTAGSPWSSDSCGDPAFQATVFLIKKRGKEVLGGGEEDFFVIFFCGGEGLLRGKKTNEGGVS